MMLVFGLITVLLAVQLSVDTVSETRKTSQHRLDQALNLTSVIARSLEKQFQYFDLSEIEEILASVRSKKDVLQITLVDRDRTFYLDGNPATSGVLAFYDNPMQVQSIKEGKTIHSVGDTVITVAEPLVQSGATLGSVLIKYRNPGIAETVIPIIKSKLGVIIPILVLGLMVAAALVSQITRPLRVLAERARSFSAGDMDQEFKVSGAREIRLLGDAFSDMILKIRESIEQIHQLAYVDRVTQLPNREFFRKELTRAINKAKRQSTSGALLFVDLDGFKKVNDTLGHDLGDKLLQYFGERIAHTLRADDLVGFEGGKSNEDISVDEPDDGLEQTGKPKPVLARLGGDEFTILLSEIREETDAASVARRIIEAVAKPFEIDGSLITIGASIGIATFPHDGFDYQTILKSADMAMYQAKDEGKNTFRYFSAELNDRASNRMQIECDLRVALEVGDQLELYYQPKIDCENGRPKSVEALVRWNHPKNGMIPPLDFIKIAEETGLILPLGEWVLNNACQQLAKFQKREMDISVAVNISTPQFEHPDFIQLVKKIVKSTGVDPLMLELEITESLAMSDPDKALKNINNLKKIGVRFAIDDFGTGYSSLSQLSRLPFDVFKIDRSFVDALSNSDDDHGRVIVKTILAMAKSLNYETVAEGVEDFEQYEFLSKNGCDFAQGYLFARPMPVKDLEEWLDIWVDRDVSALPDQMKLGAA